MSLNDLFVLVLQVLNLKDDRYPFEPSFSLLLENIRERMYSFHANQMCFLILSKLLFVSNLHINQLNKLVNDFINFKYVSLDNIIDLNVIMNFNLGGIHSEKSNKLVLVNICNTRFSQQGTMLNTDLHKKVPGNYH
jgi:hypothetical protein